MDVIRKLEFRDGKYTLENKVVAVSPVGSPMIIENRPGFSITEMVRLYAPKDSDSYMMGTMLFINVPKKQDETEQAENKKIEIVQKMYCPVQYYRIEQKPAENPTEVKT